MTVFDITCIELSGAWQKRAEHPGSLGAFARNTHSAWRIKPLKFSSGGPASSDAKKRQQIRSRQIKLPNAKMRRTEVKLLAESSRVLANYLGRESSSSKCLFVLILEHQQAGLAEQRFVAQAVGVGALIKQVAVKNRFFEITLIRRGARPVGADTRRGGIGRH
jgi:hypothetical protein